VTTKSEHLAELRFAFVLRWKPGLIARRHDFEMDLDRIISAAYVAAQEPFIRELETFKANLIGTRMILSPSET
jgi:hypothetical protein